MDRTNPFGALTDPYGNPNPHQPYPGSPPLYPSGVGGQPYDPGQGPVPPQPRLKLEPADMRIIKECNRESFYKRCESLCKSAACASRLVLNRSTNHGCNKWLVVCTISKVSAKERSAIRLLFSSFYRGMVCRENLVPKDMRRSSHHVWKQH